MCERSRRTLGLESQEEKTAKQSCTRGVGWVSEEGISDLGSGDPNVILKSKEMNSRRVKKVNKLDFGGPINWKV